MLRELTTEDKEKLRVLHDKIKNHEFRANPTFEQFDEYKELLDRDLNRIIGRYQESGKKYYTFIKNQKLMVNGEEEFWNIEAWSNPIIGILNEAQHDYRSICMEFRRYFKDGSGSRMVGEMMREKFFVTSETMLTLIHFLIEDRELTEVTLPGEFFYKDTHYEFVQNPKYDNLWTKKWILEHQVMDSEKETTDNKTEQ